MRESKDAVMARQLTVWAACAAALLCMVACGRTDGVGEHGRATAVEGSLAGLEAVARGFPAVDDRPLRWPSDHASHPEHFTESWLVAGLLRDEDGRRYGFQLLLQRVALQQADAEERASAWAAGAVWQGVFSFEPEGAQRVVTERYSREALGLAGALEDLPTVWLEDWRLEIAPDASTGHVQGVAEGIWLRLSFRLPGAPPLGTTADARRGYWWPGLEAIGTLELEGQSLAVEGSALLDRSWGQSPPAGRGQLALVRLWAQDEDGMAMRCEQLRRRGGGGVPLGECIEFPTGRAVTHMPEPAGESAAGVPQRLVPLEWMLQGPGAAGPRRWRPLAQPGVAGAAWSGIMVPADEVPVRAQWGVLSLSNFAAP
jgi:predicted secreted hydrolase